MATRDKLLELAERAEAAPVEGETLDILSEAYGLIFGWVPRGLPLAEYPSGALERQARFTRLLDAKAWLDAAMSLKPDDFVFDLSEHDDASEGFTAFIAESGVEDGHFGRATTPALALTAAALRALAEKGGE